MQRPANVLLKLKDLTYGRLKFAVGIQNDAEDFLSSLARAVEEDCERHRCRNPFDVLACREVFKRVCSKCNVASEATSFLRVTQVKCQVNDNECLTLSELYARAAATKGILESHTCQSCGGDPVETSTLLSQEGSMALILLPRIQSVQSETHAGPRKGKWGLRITDDIIAMVSHFGSVSFNNGHYIAYVRQSSSDSWMEYDDDDVSNVILGDHELRCAYLLLVRCSAAAAAGPPPCLEMAPALGNCA